MIRSWNLHDWIGIPARVGDKIGRLIGAAPGQVVAADSISVNLFKLLAAAVALRPERRVILTDRDNFPTDLYMASGLARLLDRGHRIERVGGGEIEAALARIGGETAVVMLTHVNFKTGRRLDMARLTDAAHAAGAVVLWDLAHSAGAMPLHLDDLGVDLAVGCGYKFLNGGPGSPAFLYVAERHQADIEPALPGWMGHATPFALDAEYAAAPGIGRMLCGTPTVLGMTALEAAVDQLAGVDLSLVREKSVALAELFHDLVAQELDGHDFEWSSPLEANERGSQVCMTHPEGYPIVRALIERGVIGDFRSPATLRFGLTPLYLRYTDVWDAVATLRQIMETRAWDRPELRERARVT